MQPTKICKQRYAAQALKGVYKATEIN